MESSRASAVLFIYKNGGSYIPYERTLDITCEFQLYVYYMYIFEANYGK